MDIVPIGLAQPPLHAGAGGRQVEAAAQFELMFYKMLLQSARWTPGAGGAQALLGDITSDLLAQSAAAQQQGFGALMLAQREGA